MSQAHELPANLAALAESRIDEGTPDGPLPRAFMLDRHQTERLMRAARAIVAAGPVMELPAGYTMVRSTLITELANALAQTNIGL